MGIDGASADTGLARACAAPSTLTLQVIGVFTFGQGEEVSIARSDPSLCLRSPRSLTRRTDMSVVSSLDQGGLVMGEAVTVTRGYRSLPFLPKQEHTSGRMSDARAAWARGWRSPSPGFRFHLYTFDYAPS